MCSSYIFTVQLCWNENSSYILYLSYITHFSASISAYCHSSVSLTLKKIHQIFFEIRTEKLNYIFSSKQHFFNYIKYLSSSQISHTTIHIIWKNKLNLTSTTIILSIYIQNDPQSRALERAKLSQIKTLSSLCGSCAPRTCFRHTKRKVCSCRDPCPRAIWDVWARPPRWRGLTRGPGGRRGADPGIGALPQNRMSLAAATRASTVWDRRMKRPHNLRRVWVSLLFILYCW